jgi:hypothetical protein
MTAIATALRTAAEWPQADRHHYAGLNLPDAPPPEGTRWVHVPDYRLDVLRRLCFGGWTDAQLRDALAAADGPGNAARAFSAWYPGAEARPVVLVRRADGTHAFGFHAFLGKWTVLYAHLAGVATTVPALVGVPPGLPPARVAFRGEAVELEVHRPGYRDGGRTAVTARTLDTGEPYSTVTVNLPDEPLGEDEVFVKDYSGGEGTLAALEEAGLARATGRSARSGFVTVPAALLLI